MDLARIIDGHLNLAWYQKTVTALQTIDRHKSYARLQCFSLLYELEPTIALLVDQMPDDVRVPICLYLLLIRCLRAIERDESIPIDLRFEALKEFPSYLGDPKLLFKKNPAQRNSIGEAMWHFDLLVSEFSHLELRFQCIIIDGVTETARGLMNFVKKSVLKTSTEFNLYCYYHGGLDWIEIIKIIIATGYLEHPYLANEEHLCNACGLVLAKTDSIVNFREAIQRGTFQWPQEYWEIYCKGELADLLNPYRSTAMRFCLNHMVLDAMQHVMDVFSLLSRIEDQKIFAVQNLANIYGGNVPADEALQKTRLATLHCEMNGLSDYRSMLHTALLEIKEKAKPEDPTFGQITILLAQLETLCNRTRNRSISLVPWQLSLGVFLELALIAFLGTVISIIVYVK